MRIAVLIGAITAYANTTTVHVATPERCVCAATKAPYDHGVASGQTGVVTPGFTREVVEEELFRAGFDAVIATEGDGECARVVGSTRLAIEKFEPALLVKVRAAHDVLLFDEDPIERKHRALTMYDDAVEGLVVSASDALAATITDDVASRTRASEAYYRAFMFAKRRDPGGASIKYQPFFDSVVATLVRPLSTSIARTCVDERIGEYRYRWVTAFRGK